MLVLQPEHLMHREVHSWRHQLHAICSFKLYKGRQGFSYPVQGLQQTG